MRIFIILFLGSLFIVPGKAQSEFQQAFQQGNADLLAPYLADEIDLCLVVNEQTLPKSRAIQELKNFFASHKVQSYKPMHSGGGEGHSKSYSISNLSTSKGDFRVYVYYKKPGGKLLIEEIRIE